MKERLNAISGTSQTPVSKAASAYLKVSEGNPSSQDVKNAKQLHIQCTTELKKFIAECGEKLGNNENLRKYIDRAKSVCTHFENQNDILRGLLEAAQKREQLNQEMRSRFNTLESIAGQAKRAYNEIIGKDCRSQKYIDLKHEHEKSVRKVYSLIKECTPHINNNKGIRDLISDANKLCTDLERQARELNKKATEQQRKAQELVMQNAELARKQELTRQDERRRRSSQARRNSNPPPRPPTRPAAGRQHPAPPPPSRSSGKSSGMPRPRENTDGNLNKALDLHYDDEMIARQFQIEEQINERNRRNKTGRRTVYTPAQEKKIAEGKSLYSILSPSELKTWAKGCKPEEKINMSESQLLQAIKPF